MNKKEQVLLKAIFKQVSKKTVFIFPLDITVFTSYVFLEKKGTDFEIDDNQIVFEIEDGQDGQAIYEFTLWECAILLKNLEQSGLIRITHEGRPNFCEIMPNSPKEIVRARK